MRIYVDSSPIIYAVERVAPYDQSVNRRLSAAGVSIVSSELARMECLILPLRSGNSTLAKSFETWFDLQTAELVAFTAAVFRRAAEIRALHNFRTPDALHLAAAAESGCAAFLTNDTRLSRFPDMAVEVI